jgi:hypothetical protein
VCHAQFYKLELDNKIWLRDFLLKIVYLEKIFTFCVGFLTRIYMGNYVEDMQEEMTYMLVSK